MKEISQIISRLDSLELSTDPIPLPDKPFTWRGVVRGSNKPLVKAKPGRKRKEIEDSRTDILGLRVYLKRDGFKKPPKRRKQTKKQSDTKRWFRARRLRTYGLTEESYLALLESQNHKCPLCGVEISEARQLAPATGGRAGYRLVTTATTIAIDHCHATGKVRGLLCSLCNRGLGDFKDDPERLRRAADYLEVHR